MQGYSATHIDQYLAQPFSEEFPHAVDTNKDSESRPDIMQEMTDLGHTAMNSMSSVYSLPSGLTEPQGMGGRKLSEAEG